MSARDDPRDGGGGGGARREEEEEEEEEELPQMDGSCDACEPDEPQPATLACHACSFAFCPAHGAAHAASTRHPLAPYEHHETGRDSGEVGGAEEEEEEGPAGARGAGMGARMGLGRQALVSGKLAAMIQGVKDGVAAAAKIQGAVPAGVGEDGGWEAGEGEDGAEGAGAEAEAGGEEAVVEPGRRDTVTVERLRCKVHGGQEGSLYCKPDEAIICVVCAVQGEHRGHEVITLHEAFLWQKSRDGYDLLGCTQRMAEKIKTKWTNPEMTTDELEAYVNVQFDELHRLVRLEEKRTLHLVDLKEAFLTASAAEKIAEITVHTEKLQEEMACITHQLGLLDQAEAQAGGGVGLPGLVQVLGGAAGPRPGPRPPRDIEARPRLPEPRREPRDYEDSEPGPSAAPDTAP